MTTATTELYSSRAPRAAATTSPLLSVLALLLGVSLRESLAAQSTASQADAAYTWGL